MNTHTLMYTATWQYSYTGRYWDQGNTECKLETKTITAWASSMLTVIKSYSHVQIDQTKVSSIALTTECDILDDENRSVAMSLEKSDHGFV